MSNKSLSGAHESQTILVTGGAGFIGSHTCVELLEQGYNVVIYDDLSNSSIVAVDRIRELTGASEETCAFVQASILDREALEKVFNTYDISAIIHFAGFKAVGEIYPKAFGIYTGTTWRVRWYCLMLRAIMALRMLSSLLLPRYTANQK